VVRADRLYPFVMPRRNAPALAEACLIMAAVARLGRGSAGADFRRGRGPALGIGSPTTPALSQPNSVLPVWRSRGWCSAAPPAPSNGAGIAKLGGPDRRGAPRGHGLRRLFAGLYAYSVPRFWPEQLGTTAWWYFVSISLTARPTAGAARHCSSAACSLLHALYHDERRGRRFAAAILSPSWPLYVHRTGGVYWDSGASCRLLRILPLAGVRHLPRAPWSRAWPQRCRGWDAPAHGSRRGSGAAVLAALLPLVPRGAARRRCAPSRRPSTAIFRCRRARRRSSPS
jgi:hypothetical protein